MSFWFVTVPENDATSGWKCEGVWGGAAPGPDGPPLEYLGQEERARLADKLRETF